MPEYLSPGVYVEEIETGPQPIEGVSTSTSGMVGAAEMGPITGLPRLVTSFADFVRLYGSYLPEDLWADTRFLAYAAQGFFQNGGQRLYVARVVGDNALPATRDLLDGFNDGVNDFLLTRPSEDMPESRDEITLVSNRGIENGTQITFIQRVGAGEQTETVAATAVVGNRVTLAAPTAFLYTRSAVVLIAGPAGFAAAPSLRLQTSNPGGWGNRVRVQSTPSSRTSTRLLGINLATLLRANPIAVAIGANPTGTDTITLGAAQADNLRVGDTLRFTEGVTVETRNIIAIVSGTDVQLDNTLGAPFTTASAVELVTPVSVRVNAPTANVSVNINVTPSFLVNDRVVIESTGGDLAGTVTAVAGTNDNLTVTLDDRWSLTTRFLREPHFVC